MSITLDSLKKATQQLATENSKNEEGLSGLEYLFADDIEKDDEINLDPTPAKDEPEAKDDKDTTPVADALDDLKEVALDADEDEVLTAGEVDLDDEDTVLDLSAGKKEDEKNEDDKKPVKESSDVVTVQVVVPPSDDDLDPEKDELKFRKLVLDALSDKVGTLVADCDWEVVGDDNNGTFTVDCWSIRTNADEEGTPAEVGDGADKEVVVAEGEKIKVPCTCPMCKQTQDIEVDADAYDAWQNGELIQNAFPNLSADQREALKTGICGKCWDEMFGGPEDFEDEEEYEEIAECKGFDKGKKKDENGKVIVEHDENHCKSITVHVYDIDWDVDDEKDLDQLPTSVDLDIHYCPGDDLDELVGDALAKEYAYTNNGFNFDIVKGEDADECNKAKDDAILVSESDKADEDCDYIRVSVEWELPEDCEDAEEYGLPNVVYMKVPSDWYDKSGLSSDALDITGILQSEFDGTVRDVDPREIPFDKIPKDADIVDGVAWARDVEGLDESAIGDAFKSIGQGIGGLLKTTLKGVGVLLAGLGGSFLFGLPGLLLAVCVAFGLMSAKECKKIEVDEGMSDVKNKLKAVIKIFKADPKKAKEINDRVLAAKKSGDKAAIQAAAAEVKALAGAPDPKNPKGGKPEGDEVQVTERNKTPLDERLREWAHVYVDLLDRALNEMKEAEEAKEDAGDFDEKAPKFVSNIFKFLTGAAVDFDPALVDQIIGWAVNGTGGVDDDEIFADKVAEYLGGHLERIWLSVDDEDEFADAADQMLRGLFVAVRAPKEGKAANLRRNAKLIETYIEVGGGEGLQVAERHGEFKRSKFKKDKWGDGRRGRPRPEDDEEEDEYDDLDLVDDEDDEPTYAEVAEDDKVSLKDITADQVKAIADMDPKAREEMSKMKPEDREQAMAMLGIEVTEDDDEEGKKVHTYCAYFDQSVPVDFTADGIKFETDEGDEYAVGQLAQILEFEEGDLPIDNVTKDGQDWYDEFNNILDKLMAEDRVYDNEMEDDWEEINPQYDDEDEDDEDDDDEEVDETTPVKQPEDPTDGRPEENIPPEYEVADECDVVKEDPCPDCGAEMREEPHTGNQRCPRCHHFQRGSYKPSIFETTDVSTSRQLQKFLKECNTFKKSPRLRKSVAKFTKMIHESPRKAQTLVNYLDRQFKGKPVSERRFCQAFVKAL